MLLAFFFLLPLLILGSITKFHDVVGNSFRQIAAIKSDPDPDNLLFSKVILHTELLLYDVIVVQSEEQEGVQEVLGDLFAIVHHLLHDISNFAILSSPLQDDESEEEVVYRCSKRTPGFDDFCEWAAEEIVQLYIPLANLFLAQEYFSRYITNKSAFERVMERYNIFAQFLTHFLERSGIEVEDGEYVRMQVYERILPEWVFLLAHKITLLKGKTVDSEGRIEKKYGERLRHIYHQFPSDSWEHSLFSRLLKAIGIDINDLS